MIFPIVSAFVIHFSPHIFNVVYVRWDKSPITNDIYVLSSNNTEIGNWRVILLELKIPTGNTTRAEGRYICFSKCLYYFCFSGSIIWCRTPRPSRDINSQHGTDMWPVCLDDDTVVHIGSPWMIQKFWWIRCNGICRCFRK